jgi:RNA polymerase sigma-70 factor (ECF subfamily)
MRHEKILLFKVYRFQDAEAYGQLYDHYFERLRRYIFFKVPHAEDADELTSELFLRGWEYATSTKVDNINAVFYRIARNLIADFYRSRKITGPLEEAENIASGYSVEESVMIKEEFRHIMQRLKELKEEYRDILIMKYLDEMSNEEIADALEKSTNNVRVLLHRAKKALQELN